MIQNLPSNPNTRRIGYTGITLLAVGGLLALTGAWEGLSGIFLVGVQVDDINDRILIFVTLFFAGMVSFMAGGFLLQAYQREREGLVMIDWLGKMDDLVA